MKRIHYKDGTYMDVEDKHAWENTNGTCRACMQPLVSTNFDSVADGCPCNSRRGINHGLIPEHTCTCPECDPEQTGGVRKPKLPRGGYF